MKKILVFTVIFVLIVGAVAFGATGGDLWMQSQTGSIVSSLYRNIQTHFFDEKTGLYYSFANDLYNRPAYLWSVAALFQAFDEMQKTSLLKKNDLLENMLTTINYYYDNVTSISSRDYGGYDSYVVKLGGGARYYDDNEWLGLALVDAYEITDNPIFLSKAEQIFKFIENGYDNKLGGGIYWEEGGNSKNTCSNGPAIVLSLKLYEITHEASYLSFAKTVYDWTNEHLLSPEGIYWDHIDLNGHVNKDIFTYNTGIMIQAMVLLYKITGDQNYLKQAQKTAENSLIYFAPNGNFPFWDDGSFWFNAVLLRGYQSLYETDKSDVKYVDVFSQWAHEKN